MENLDQDLTAHVPERLAPTRMMREDWHNTARWANFVAIVGFVFVGIGLLGIGGVSTMLTMLNEMGMGSPELSILGSMSTGLTVFMLVMLAVQFALNLFQYRFATQLKRAVQYTDQPAFEQAWLHFRNLFRWSGILVIILIIFYIGFAVFAVTMLMGTRGL